MVKKLTITVSDEVYNGLHEKIGPRKISRFIDRLTRPYVVGSALEGAYARARAVEDLEDLYREAAQDSVAEAHAAEWIEAGFGETLANEKPDAAG